MYKWLSYICLGANFYCAILGTALFNHISPEAMSIRFLLILIQLLTLLVGMMVSDLGMHAIERAKERYNLDINEFDIAIISILIQQGLAKEVTHTEFKFVRKNVTYWHLRYGGKLIEAVVLDVKRKAIILTFLPTGKKRSFKKYYRSKMDKDYLERQKRLRG